jgi:hypothetical protein
MYMWLAGGDISRRSLTDDDKAGIVAIYGKATTGLEDHLLIYDGWTSITQNSNPWYYAHFIDEDPYGDKIVGNSTWSLLVEHAEGEYVAASYTWSGFAYVGLHLGTLPYGYCWARDASGNVRARIVLEGVDDDGVKHTADYHIVITGVPGNTTSGALTHDETWGDENILSGSVLVPAGVTLKILPGSTVKFPAGASLIVNGTLNASGNFVVDPIVFTSTASTSSGAWGSIVLSGSGASGSTLSSCNIQYGTEVDVNSANNVTIQNCNITNNSGHGINVNSCNWFLAQGNTITNSNVNHGIVIFGGSNNNCYDNTIYKTDHNLRGVGIYYTASSGRVARNDVEWYSWGLGANYGATPYSFGQYNNRNNRIANCYYGLIVYASSSVYFGVVSDAHYNYNSIYNNTWNAYTYNSSNITAHYDYWGGTGTPPPASKFYCGTGCSLDYGQSSNWWLPTDPWTGFPTHSTLPAQPPEVQPDSQLQPIASISKVESSTAASSYETSSVENPIAADSLLQGITLRGKGKSKEAKDFFRSYLDRHYDNQVAYAYLYGCADSETSTDIIRYFESLPKRAAKEHKLLLSNLYLMQGDVKSARRVNKDIMDANKNTPLGIRAKLNDFYIVLYNENDPKAALTILKEVEKQSKLLNPMDILTAETIFKNYVDPKTGNMPNAESSFDHSLNVIQLAEDGLLENYPNPFNPSTKIAYSLSVAGHVTLKVYDIIGREVATLVNDQQDPGYHEAAFDASRLASGVYFYRISTGTFTAIKKMLLVK